VAQEVGPEPGNGVSSREQVSPGNAPVWSDEDGKMIPGVVANEHTHPLEFGVRLPCCS